MTTAWSSIGFLDFPIPPDSTMNRSISAWPGAERCDLAIRVVVRGVAIEPTSCQFGS